MRIVATATAIGVGFDAIWALLGYAATRGRRDFSSVKTVVATRYEVLVEHRHLAQAQDLVGRASTAGAFD